MSLFVSGYRMLLKPFLALAMREKSIPENPKEELNYNTIDQVLYILPSLSQSELLILQKHCLKLNLPDPLKMNEFEGEQLPRYVFLESNFYFDAKRNRNKTLRIFNRYFWLHRQHKNLNVHLIPVSVLFGRIAEKQKQPLLQKMGIFSQAYNILRNGRDTYIRFSNGVSLRYMSDNYKDDSKIGAKLMRVARIHFSKQRYSAKGPKIPDRNAIFAKILQSEKVKKAIEDEVKNSKMTTEQVQKEAVKILDEIAADVKPSYLKTLSRLLAWLWKRLYNKGIDVNNAKVVRELSLNGHEIVYVPNHRSHIDYLLLSYILYHEGLATPYIAAGVNLNFFPAGKIFRSSGAFFIRRTFKGNKLYATLFKSYLAELFHQGYPVEYFIEGGRSRTGRILPPKTGMMAMTLDAISETNRPISIVPVYIGYDNVIEVDTYMKELKGAKKEKENAFLVFRVLKKLRNLGKGFVTFGEPISLNKYLNEHYPDWKNELNDEKPKWFNQAVTNVAEKTMININKASAVSPKNLASSALLSSNQCALTKQSLVQQINSYLSLLRNVHYSNEISIPNENGAEILAYLQSLPKVGLTFEKDIFGEIIRLDHRAAVLQTYDRNNISHLLVIPSLICKIIFTFEKVSKDFIINIINEIYPFLQKELFLHFNEESLPLYIDSILKNFEEQKLFVIQENIIVINKEKIETIELHSSLICESLDRYHLCFSLLNNQEFFQRDQFEQQTRLIAQRLSILYGINAPEFFDKVLFSCFSQTLADLKFIDQHSKINHKKVEQAQNVLKYLIPKQMQLSIKGIINNNGN